MKKMYTIGLMALILTLAVPGLGMAINGNGLGDGMGPSEECLGPFGSGLGDGTCQDAVGSNPVFLSHNGHGDGDGDGPSEDCLGPFGSGLGDGTCQDA